MEAIVEVIRTELSGQKKKKKKKLKTTLSKLLCQG